MQPASTSTLPSASANFRPLSILVGTAYFMEQLDSTIIGPVIPDIARDFGVDPLSLNVTMTVYLLCSLIFMPLSGLLSSRFSARTVFVSAVSLFIASSVLCAMAPNALALTATRGLQGIGASMMVPVGRAAIVHTTGKTQLVEAMAWMMTMAMFGPLVGPPLGGLISSYLTWHWIFLINVPVGALGLLAGMRIMPNLRQRTDSEFNLREWLLAGATISCVVAALETMRHAREITAIAGLLLLLTALVCLYVYMFRRLERPMLDFRLLSVKTFTSSFSTGALLRVGYGSLPFLLPLMLQLGLGYTALQSGIVLLASGVVAFFTKAKTGQVLRRWGFKRVLFWNGLLCAVALAGCSLFFLPGWNLYTITAVVSLAALFRSVQFNAITAISYADLPPSKVATSTILNTMAWQLAIVLGISLSTLIVQYSATWLGHPSPTGIDFAIAFLAVALFGFASLPWYWKLPSGAGDSLNAH